MFTYMQAFSGKQSTQARQLNNYRFRKTADWGDEEKKDAASFFASIGKRGNFGYDNGQHTFDADRIRVEPFPQHIAQNYDDAAKFCERQQQVFNKLFSDEHLTTGTNNMFSKSSSLYNPSLPASTDNKKIIKLEHESLKVLRKVTELENACLPHDPTKVSKKRRQSRKRYRNGQHISPDLEAERYLANRKLSRSQSQVIDRVLNYFKAVNKYKYEKKIQILPSLTSVRMVYVHQIFL
jgi:hypothetical protein